MGTISKCRLGDTTSMANTIFLPLLEDIVSLKGVISGAYSPSSEILNDRHWLTIAYRSKPGYTGEAALALHLILSSHRFPRQVAPTFSEKSQVIASCK